MLPDIVIFDPATIDVTIPVSLVPLPTYDVAVITPALPNLILFPTSNCPPLTLTPDLNVPIPSESTFVTS